MSGIGEHIVELRDLEIGYENKSLFSGLNIEFNRGEFVALLGRNGVGKSTLLRTIVGLQKALSGEVLLDGRTAHTIALKERSALVSFVSTYGVGVTNLKVRDVVGLGRTPYTNWLGTLTERDEQVVDKALESVDMVEFSTKTLDKLSDGERQRVMVARALAQQTPVILLDEPTAYLDIPNRYDIFMLLKKLAHKENKMIFFSTHELGIALEMCDKLAVLHHKECLYGTTEQLLSNGGVDSLFGNSKLYYDSDMGVIRSIK